MPSIRRIGYLLLAFCLLVLLHSMPSAQAAIVFRGSSSGINTGLPMNGSPGALTINRPAAARPGMVMIVSIAARPSRMTWTTPAGGPWTPLSIASEQLNGGVNTAPGGMTMRSYYRIVGLNEPTSYTWTFANPQDEGGTAVAGMLVFSGIDTGTNPINGTPTSVLSAAGNRFTTAPVTTDVNGTMMISVLSVLSGIEFNTPTLVASTPCTNSGASAMTDVLDIRSPVALNVAGTTINMAYFTQTRAGVSCATTATITNTQYNDNGVAHLMALRPSERDLTLEMTRNVPLSPGGAATYSIVATNDGTKSEPGPLAIVNTLPTGLTYSGFSGNGWSCSASGQTVTCSRAGAIAVDASAPALNINVSVAQGLSGVITNSALVSGTGGDGNSDNDTATNTYVILPQPYAYYALDETSNAVSFVNSNALTAAPASALGSSKSVGNPPTIGAALAGNPGTCGAVSNPAAAGSGINTGIDVNSIGTNAGSISFWYAGNTAWNDGVARTLFDASDDLGTGTTVDRHFLLAKDGSGRLVFSLKDSAGTVTTATSVSYVFGAATWHHIAVTWDLAADRLYIYLDGDSVPIATSTVNVNGVLGAMDTLYMGAQRTTGITGAPAAYTANGANGYFDEIRIYNRALVPLEVEGIADLIHACAGTVDHYELIVPATASACTPLPVVQVYACAGPAGTSSCSGNLQAAVNGKTVTLATNAGTLGTTSPIFDAIGQANTTLNFPTGGSATITLSGGSAPSAGNPARCCVAGSSCVTANSCITQITACSVAAVNFAVVDSHYADKSYDTAPDHQIYTKLAGLNETGGAASTTFRLDVAALKANGLTETAYIGAGSPNKAVRMDIVDDSAGPSCNGTPAACTSCSKTVVGSVGAVTFTAANAGYQNDVAVTLTTTNAYPRLIARIVDNNASPALIACSSDAFVVRPSAVVMNTSAAAMPPPDLTVAGVRAGVPFTLSASTASGSNYSGILTQDIDLLDAQNPALATPAGGGSKGTLSPTTLIANAATLNNATYSDVGYLYLNPNAYRDEAYTAVDQNGGCTAGSNATVKVNGRYGCWIGAQSTVSLGRFVPHHFVTALVPGDATYTYSGQPFTSMTVTAVNATGGTTLNYRSLLASPVTLADANAAGNNSGTLGALTLAGGAPTLAANRFVSGVALLNGTLAADALVYTFTSRQTPPLEARTGSLPLQLNATSSVDAVSSSGFESGAISPILSGRVRVSNAYGTASLPLSVPAVVQYYSPQGWVTNVADTGAAGTHLLAAPLVTTAGVSSTAMCPTLACTVNEGFTNGALDLRMTAPSTPGYADIVLKVPSWLDYPWHAAGIPGPRARATFGIYAGKNRVIYRRERY